MRGKSYSFLSVDIPESSSVDQEIKMAKSYTHFTAIKHFTNMHNAHYKVGTIVYIQFFVLPLSRETMFLLNLSKFHFPSQSILSLSLWFTDCHSPLYYARVFFVT